MLCDFFQHQCICLPVFVWQIRFNIYLCIGLFSTIHFLQKVIRKYSAKRAREYEKVEKDLLEKLKRRGISGSAVQAAVEGSEEWEEARARIRPEFEKELDRLKKGLEIQPNAE